MWLMAAAPKLLTALQAVRDELTCKLDDEHRRLIDSVITEATTGKNTIGEPTD